MRSPLLTLHEHLESYQRLSTSTDSRSRSWTAVLVLVYGCLQIIWILGWSISMLYAVNILSSVPGGWILGFILILVGIGAAPNLSQVIMIKTVQLLQFVSSQQYQDRVRDESTALIREKRVQKRP